ncbi:P22 phage major capsid protein family protein [Cryobacterium sp. GrIS_2_6]|uniref:P22 phage major capsid protein family protein n=1 Tax=Cryobacterium sp. GrIS_2_6 TaxID=3162785 RepID=UPI002DFE233A|nr:hypothetical protein [Cryobacterium psychrotolerans]
MNNTSNAAFIPTIIAKEALGYFGATMNLAKSVSKNTDWSTATEGQVLQIPKRGALVVNQKADNANVVVQQPTASNVSVTLNKHPEVTFGIDDVTKVLENQNVLIGYGQDAAKVLAESVESSLAALYAGLSNPVITFDTTSYTTLVNSVLAIRKYFTDQKVSILEDRNVMVSSGVYNALLGVPQFSQAQNIGTFTNTQATPIVTGRVLSIYGLNFWESQLVPQTGTTGAFVDHNIAYTKDALVLASRPLPEVEAGQGAVSAIAVNEDIGMAVRATLSYNPQTLAHQVTIDCLYGVAVVDSRRAVEVDFTHA